MIQSLENLINELRLRKRLKSLENIEGPMELKRDLGLDSLDLAVLGIRIQEVFKVDIFSLGNIRTVQELRDCLNEKP